MYQLQHPSAISQAGPLDSELLQSKAQLTSCHKLTLLPTKAMEGQPSTRWGDWLGCSLQACSSTV